MTHGRPRVKICGITGAEDAQQAVALGADALGFVFWPGSPRLVAPERARAIIAGLPPFIARVGVFVNASHDEVAEVIRVTNIDVVQLHGDESVGAFADLGVRLLRSVEVDTDEAVAEATRLPSAILPLVDASNRQMRGGTGQRADWSRAAIVASSRRIILAGGLDAANVGRAIAQVGPWAVDVSSGVEREPGVKDHDRLRDFFAAVAAASLEGV